MPAGAPDKIRLHTEALANSRLEAEETLTRLCTLFDSMLRAMEGITEEGMPISPATVDLKHPVGNAAWKAHIHVDVRAPGEPPMMPHEDDLTERARLEVV